MGLGFLLCHFWAGRHLWRRFWFQFCVVSGSIPHDSQWTGPLGNIKSSNWWQWSFCFRYRRRFLLLTSSTVEKGHLQMQPKCRKAPWWNSKLRNRYHRNRSNLFPKATFQTLKRQTDKSFKTLSCEVMHHLSAFFWKRFMSGKSVEIKHRKREDLTQNKIHQTALIISESLIDDSAQNNSRRFSTLIAIHIYHIRKHDQRLAAGIFQRQEDAARLFKHRAVVQEKVSYVAGQKRPELEWMMLCELPQPGQCCSAFRES